MLVYHFFSDPRKGGPHVFVDSIKMYHRDNITTKIVTMLDIKTDLFSSIHHT